MAGTPGPIANSNEPTGSSNGAVGSTPSDWRSSLPDELRTEPTLVSFRDVPALAKSYLEVRKGIGDSIRVPKDGASPEEWDKLYDKLGRPATPEAYNLKAPDGVPVDETLQSWAHGAFHKAGLTPQQARSIYNGYLEQAAALAQKAEGGNQQAAESARTALTQEWGHTYDSNMISAKSAVMALGGQELLDALDRTGAGNDPVVIKAFAKYGSALKEGGLVRGDEMNSQDDQASAQQEINAILAQADTHPMSPMNKKLYGKGMDAAIEHWRRLHERAHPPERAA